MTTPDTRDWSYHTERLRYAETHLAEFLFLADNNRSDIALGQNAQKALAHALKALLAAAGSSSLTHVSRASTKHTSGAEQKCTTREVIGQRKCPRQLFGRSVTEAGWQQAGRVSE